MSYKICPKCAAGNQSFMIGTVTQAFEVPSGQQQITDYVCPHCAYVETETLEPPALMGNYNSGVGRLMKPVLLQDSWGIYNSGIAQ